jgi:hypothetical protein
MKTPFFARFVFGCGLMVILAGILLPRPASAQVYDPYFTYALGPAVRIVSPPNHAVFCAPVNIPMLAFTRLTTIADFTNVEFYANGVDLGHGTRLYLPVQPIYGLASPGIMSVDILGRLHELWSFDWSNAPAGSYTITVVASGIAEEFAAPIEEGISRTSPPVNITIVSTTPPATNFPDIVTIVATDPIAIAGTNTFWRWPGLTNAVPAWTNWPSPITTWFTNWGPKSALFTVYRFGSVSNDITVNYNIGGTASNGVDYFALPGNIDIPAGYTRAVIPVVPIDHGTNGISASIARTVILTVTPDTNAPPDYLVGIPKAAEALILETWPRPLPWLLPDGTFHLNASGPDGAWFDIQVSSDLVNWTSISTNQVFDGAIDFVDPNAPNNGTEFYQAVPTTEPPSD